MPELTFASVISGPFLRKQGGKSTLEWSPRFEHGFSQVVDWFWKLSDMENTREFASRFVDELYAHLDTRLGSYEAAYQAEENGEA